MCAFILISCDNDNTGGGGTPLTATLTGTTIPITGQGITAAQFNTAVANIKTAHDILNETQIPIFASKVKAIQVVAGSTVILEGTTLKVGVGADDETIAEYFWFNIVATQIQPKTARGVILT